MKSKHILVTTDLSAEAARAFAPACQFAEWLDARITLLYIAQDSPVPPLASPADAALCMPDLEREQAEAEQRLATQAEAFPSGFEVTTRVVRGTDAAGSIAAFAKLENVDLVVVSTHGHTGFRRLVLGSVAEAVVREVAQPVLTVPRQDANAANLQVAGHVLLTTDLSEKDLLTYGRMVGLLKENGCKVTVLHVMPGLSAVTQGASLAHAVPSSNMPKSVAKAQQALEAQSAFLDEDLAYKTVVSNHLDPATGVVEYAREHKASLIAISTHGRKGLRRLALGSVAARVLRESPVPVLHFHRTRA